MLESLQNALAAAVLRLPRPLVSLLAGKPVVLDGQTLDPQLQLLLRLMALQGGPEIHEMSPADARAFYRQVGPMLGGTPPQMDQVRELRAPGPGGEVPLRVYVPKSLDRPAPVLVWYHGGGWVIGDLDTADSTCRALANRAGCVVVSVGYRLAPEHPAPAALDDCMTALAWTVENFELLGVDASKVAVGGDSAGGNLAALVCQRVRAEFGPDIDFQLLVYPVTDLLLGHPSMSENAEGYLLTRATMEWFVQSYLGDIDPKDPSVSPLHADDLSGLPPAMVITAELDPLRDEGEAYALRLREAGVPTELVRYDGQVHFFFSLSTLLDDGKDALDRAGAALRAALA